MYLVVVAPTPTEARAINMNIVVLIKLYWPYPIFPKIFETIMVLSKSIPLLHILPNKLQVPPLISLEQIDDFSLASTPFCLVKLDIKLTIELYSIIVIVNRILINCFVFFDVVSLVFYLMRLRPYSS